MSNTKPRPSSFAKRTSAFPAAPPADTSRDDADSEAGGEASSPPIATPAARSTYTSIRRTGGTSLSAASRPTSPPDSQVGGSGRPSIDRLTVDDAPSSLPSIATTPRIFYDAKRNSSSTLETPRSRPTTPSSRTHIPSFTSRAFISPMSSQRLQAQRGQRNSQTFRDSFVATDETDTADDGEDNKTRTHRNSIGSVVTTKPGLPVPQFEADPLPRFSTGTRYTDWNEQEQQNGGSVFGGDGANGAWQNKDRHDPTLQQNDAHHISLRNLSPRLISNGFGKSGAQPKGNGHIPLPSQESSVAAMKAKQAEVKRNLGKNWEYFEGNTLFCWGGRIQTAKDKPILLVTLALVVFPAILFFIYEAPWYWHNYSPAVPIIFAYLLFLTLSSLFHGAFSDPGILPRNLHIFPPSDSEADPLDLGPPTSDWVLVASASASNGAFEVPVKYCKTCQIWRPPRCHHCRVCDSCIDGQDHHCMWLNNCVGRRNYRYFFSFVTSASMTGIFLWAASAAQIQMSANNHHTSFSHAISYNRGALALMIYGLFAFAYPVSLWGYHWFLMSRGQSTREYLNANHFKKTERHRPFDRKSWVKNWFAVLFRPRAPTFLQFKKQYEEGDQRLAAEKADKTPVNAMAQLTRDRAERKSNKNKGDLEMQQGTFHGPRGPINGPPVAELDGSVAGNSNAADAR